MKKCPFLEDHPDLFIAAVALLVCAYTLYYGLYCISLYLLNLMTKCKLFFLYDHFKDFVLSEHYVLSLIYISIIFV